MKSAAHLSVILLIALFSSSKVASGQDVCPLKSESSLKKVRSFLSDSAWAQEREGLGIAVSADRVRALSDKQDTAVCRHLAETFDIETENLFRSYYKAGPYYFVVSRAKERPGDDIYGGPTGFILLDKELEAVRFYM